MAILFVSGINDRSVIGLTLDEAGNTGHLIDGNCSIHGQVTVPNEENLSVTLFGKGVRQRAITFNRKPSLVFNQIADPDTHRGALERCAALCSAAAAPVINHPEAVLRTTRDQVSETLQGIPGVIVPRTVRFNPLSPEAVLEAVGKEEFDFPFIVRVAGDHGGKSMIRVDGRQDVRALHVYPFDGRDFYLTEFVDCRDDHGLYHRQRLIVIDGKPVLRGSLYDQNWIVHGASRYFMLQRESWEDDGKRSHWLESEVIPRARDAIDEITARLGLELYGIDCSLDSQGEMLLFEANANMNFLTNDHPQLNERMEGIKRRIQAMMVRHAKREAPMSRD